MSTQRFTMISKPGAKGKSCDFCHEHKRTCDLNPQFETGCSRCIKQGIECTFELCDPKKRKRPRIMSDGQGRVSNELEHRIPPVGATFQHSVLNPRSIRDGMSLEGSGLRSDLDQSSSLSTNEVNTASTKPRLQMLRQTLSSNSVKFLHNIFEGPPRSLPPPNSQDGSPSFASPEPQIFDSPGSPTAPILHSTLLSRGLPYPDTEPQNAFRVAHSYVLQLLSDQVVHSDKFLDRDIFVKCNLTIKDFVESLRAYFDILGEFHLFIPEDAFWEDFRAGRCSPILLAAIAYRGLAFTNAQEKWKKQQSLLVMCMSKISKIKVDNTGSSLASLDDLEAIALMTEFIRTDAQPPFSLHKWRLSMAYDSLVKGTLKRQDREKIMSGPSRFLARVEERCTLLCFYVYSVGSFQSLSRENSSFLPEDGTSLNEDNSCHSKEYYLDAMLSLSVIARDVCRKLCDPAATASGIACRDVLCLYEQLHDWRVSRLPLAPSESQRGMTEGSAENRSSRGLVPAPASRSVNLRRMILWALQIHCYLKIEACIAQHGWKDENSLATEATVHRIEYENIQAVLQAVDLAASIRQPQSADRGSVKRPLVDLAPSILRNICANLCEWVCGRAKRYWHLQASKSTEKTTSSPGNSDQVLETHRRQFLHYAGIAKLLRDTVAAASSHSDTGGLIKYLDIKLSSLQDS